VATLVAIHGPSQGSELAVAIRLDVPVADLDGGGSPEGRQGDRGGQGGFILEVEPLEL